MSFESHDDDISDSQTPRLTLHRVLLSYSDTLFSLFFPSITSSFISYEETPEKK